MVMIDLLLKSLTETKFILLLMNLPSSIDDQNMVMRQLMNLLNHMTPHKSGEELKK
jgi:hypothetical protein